MSSSDSDSDSYASSDGLNHCKCTCGYQQNDDSDDSYFSSDGDEDDSSSEELSSDETNRKNIFICVYNHEKRKNTVLISTASEIKNYRKKHSLLSDKSSRNVDSIWDDVKINSQSLSTVSLKAYYDHVDKTMKNHNLKNSTSYTQNSGTEKKFSKTTLPASIIEQKNIKNVDNTPTKSSSVKIDMKSNLKKLEEVKKSDTINKKGKSSQQISSSGGSNTNIENKNIQPQNKKISDEKVKSKRNTQENLNNDINTKNDSRYVVKSTVNQSVKINPVTAQISKNGTNKTNKNDSEHVVKSNVNEPVKTNPNDKNSNSNNSVVTTQNSKNSINTTTKNDLEHVVKSTVNVPVKTNPNDKESSLQNSSVTTQNSKNGTNKTDKNDSEHVVKSNVNVPVKTNPNDKKSSSQNSSVTTQNSKNGTNKTNKNDSEHVVKSNVNVPVKTNPNDKKSSSQNSSVTTQNSKNSINKTTKNDSEHVGKPIATQSVESNSNDKKLSSNNFCFKKPESGKVGKARKTGKTSASDNESVSSEKNQIKNKNTTETIKLDHVENMSQKKLKKLKKFERKVGNISENITKKKLKKLKQREKVLDNDKKTSSQGKTSEKKKNTSKDQLEIEKKNSSSSNSKQAFDSDSKTQKKEDSELKNDDNTKSMIENSDKMQLDKSLEENSSMGIQNVQEHEDEVDSEQEEEIDTSDNMDYLTGVENMPTFIYEVVKRKQKNGKMIPNCSKDKDDKENLKFNRVEELTTPTKNCKATNAGVIHDTAISNKNYIAYSEKYAEQAVELLIENNLMAALEYLCEAIQFNPSDQRHYLNRSYCYLRMNKNVLALEDAQYVLYLSTHVGYLFIANLRAGQASLALQKYEQAEVFLGKAVFINPESYHAQRELLRAQINCITAAGFEEMDAITALEKFSSSLQAITHLRESKVSRTENYLMDSDTCYDSYDDFIYHSSDDDDELNTVQLLNHMTNYKPGRRRIHHLIARSQKPELQISSVNALKDSFKMTEINKKIQYTKPVGQLVNSKVNQTPFKSVSKIEEKSVWVGNLTDSITDFLLKKQFGKYGSILSVYRPINEAYAFINFERHEDVVRCLNDSSIEVAGTKLVIRSATRKMII